MGVDVENGFEPEYEVIEGKKKVARGDQEGRRRGRAGATSRPTPIARARRSPGTSPRRSRTSNPNIQRVLFNEITKKAISEAIAQPDGARHEQVRVAAGAPHPRPPGRLPDQPDPVEQGAARAVGRPRAVGGGAPGRRARGGDQGVRARGVLDGRGDCRGRRRRRRSPPRSPSWTARRPSSTNEGQAREVVDELKRRRAARSPTVERKERRKNPPPPFITSQAAAGGVEQAALLAPSGRWRSRSGSTKASSWATRARSVSSPTCVPTRRASPTTRSPRCARYIGEQLRRRVPAGRADRLQDQEGRAGRPRGDPPDVARVRPRDGARAVGARQGRRPRRARDRRSAASSTR